MSNEAHRRVKNRKLRGDDIGGFQRAMSRQRTDADFLAIVPHKSETRDAVDVNQYRRPKQPEVEHRHQALAAGDDLSITTCVGQRLNGGFDTIDSDVVERRRLHRQSPLNAAGRFSANACLASR